MDHRKGLTRSFETPLSSASYACRAITEPDTSSPPGPIHLSFPVSNKLPPLNIYKKNQLESKKQLLFYEAYFFLFFLSILYY